MKQLPVEFENRMKLLLGDEFEDFKKSYDESPVRAFRVNTDKIPVEEFEKINLAATAKYGKKDIV